MIRIGTNPRLVRITAAFLVPIAAAAGVWTPPAVLSTGGQGWEAAAALDGSGNALALWDERTSSDHLWSRSETPQGVWGSVAQVSRALQTTSVFPAVRVTPAGFATAIWTDSDGVWTADRPPASNWNPAQLLIPGASTPIFVMDSQGDAVVVWTEGGSMAPHSTVMAVSRHAEGTWNAPQLVASGVHITADHAGIAENGAVVVTWESYTAVCSEGFCEVSNFILHAARQDADTAAWVDSGRLLGPDDDSHNALAALDSAGAAMLVAQAASGAFVSTTEGASGGAWSSFQPVADPQSIAIVSDLASDHAGSVTFVYETIGFSTSQAFSVNGSISGNQWSPPVVLSGNDASVSQVYFAVAPSGAALVVWLDSSVTPEIRVATRAAASEAWSSPLTVSAAGAAETAPEAAAVNSAAKAIVVYSGYNSSGVHTEYAASYRP
jgi:hypothetical protein